MSEHVEHFPATPADGDHDRLHAVLRNTDDLVTTRSRTLQIPGKPETAGPRVVIAVDDLVPYLKHPTLGRDTARGLIRVLRYGRPVNVRVRADAPHAPMACIVPIELRTLLNDNDGA